MSVNLIPVCRRVGRMKVVDDLVDGLGDRIIENHSPLLELRYHLVGDLSRPFMSDSRREFLLELSPCFGFGEPDILELLSVYVADQSPNGPDE